MTVEVLRVGEAAAVVGLSPYTLRWYEQEGLVQPVQRDASGRRQYTVDDVNWLRLLTKLRRTGMSVSDMRRYAELVRAGQTTISARLKLFEEHREQVLARIEALRQDLDAVDQKIDRYRAWEHGG